MMKPSNAAGKRWDYLSGKYSLEVIEYVKKMFSTYRSGSWIYPGEIRKFSRMKIKDIYNLLDELEHLDIVESWYELRCVHCQQGLEKVHLFNELPENFHCEICGNTLPILKNAIKIYRML